MESKKLTDFLTNSNNQAFEEPSYQKKNNEQIIREFLTKFRLPYEDQSNQSNNTETVVENISIGSQTLTRYTNEYWTAKQRQSSSIHEISYRACFKAQLPRFFINLLTKEGDLVYDPFAGRGTTGIEAGILKRRVILNDINPLSRILSEPRFYIPDLSEIIQRLDEISLDYSKESDIDLSMFYHKKTVSEIVSIKDYLIKRNEQHLEDHIDRWIRMVATNRLTGHSKGFFSVYTLPPNQAVSQESQIKINEKRNQVPDYRETKKIIIRKSKTLLGNIKSSERKRLMKIRGTAQFLTEDARNTKQIPDESVQLSITSPPFLDIVQYSKDNWLRCWFNNIDDKVITKRITMSKTIEEWTNVMSDVFKEFYRITIPKGWVAFEVGEIRKGKINLDEHVIPLGIDNGFEPFGILINMQEFTKTANIWGIENNKRGTNTNRIAIFSKS